MEATDFKDLLVWQKSMDLADNVFELTERFTQRMHFALGSHLEKTSISIPSNIAEGKNRQHIAEYRQFCYISLGSCAEIETQIILAFRRKYINQNDYDKLISQILEIRRMLRGLIRKLS